MTTTVLKTLLLVGSLLGSISPAFADVKIWNLTNAKIYYSTGYLQDGLWVSTGWNGLDPKGSASLNSNNYLRIITANSANVLTPTGYKDKAQFWQHPISSNKYKVQESSADSKEVYLWGSRTTITNLKNAGYKYSGFLRYSDGKTLKIGTHWKVGTKVLSFSHSTSGNKSESFSWLNTTIMDFSYSISCARKDKGGTLWNISKDRKSVNRAGPFLEASTVASPKKPCYNGSVTLYYAYN